MPKLYPNKNKNGQLCLTVPFEVCVDEGVGVTVRVVGLHSTSEAELVHVEAQLIKSFLWRDQPKTLHPGRAGEQMGEKWTKGNNRTKTCKAKGRE